jgi:hypothetical protein
VIAAAVLFGLLVLSVVPSVFSYLGNARYALFAGLGLLVALSGLASIQVPGRNMATFDPLAFAWLMLAVVFAVLAGLAGYMRRRVKEGS